MMERLGADFFHRDCLEVAPDLVGKLLIRQLPDGTILQERIAETEAYRGEEDEACHAHKGRTKRTELLYRESGLIYVLWDALADECDYWRTGAAARGAVSCRRCA